MARPPRKRLGVPTIPISFSAQFLPATLLLVAGLVLLGIQYSTVPVSNVQDLTATEGTLTNYSFKKTAEGELDYGFWLQELSERYVLPQQEAEGFDTTAFKNQVKIGERLRVEYNLQEDPTRTEGNRRIYSLSAPRQNKTFLAAQDVLSRSGGGWLPWLTYALIAAGLGLFIWKIYQQRQQEQETY